MKPDPRLTRLVTAADVLLDLRLAELRGCARAIAETRARIEILARDPVADPDLPPAVSAQIEHQYRLWADARRVEELQALARQTADWMEAKDRAQTALGRSDILSRLLARK